MLMVESLVREVNVSIMSFILENILECFMVMQMTLFKKKERRVM